MIHIKKHERGLMYRHGDFVRLISKPGPVRVWSFAGYHLEILSAGAPFTPDHDAGLYLEDPDFAAATDVFDVADHERGLHYVDGHLKELLHPGRYIYFKSHVRREVRKFDVRLPEIPADVVPALLRLPQWNLFMSREQVQKHEAGLLFFNGVLQRTLEAGAYYFWQGPMNVQVQRVDLRRRQIDMAGQDIMTDDKITLRLNFVFQYRIVDPVKVGTGIEDFANQLYVLLQLILREYVGTLKLDELLQKKEEVDQYVLGKLKAKADEYGVEFLYAGVKDVILPGEIKDILNLVLTAEKQAQASIVTRREETASTRSLLNTAKLMDENPTLYRLKELEYLERISARVDSISVMGGGSVLEHLNAALLRERGKE